MQALMRHMRHRSCWYLESSSPIPFPYVRAHAPDYQGASDKPLTVRYIPDWFPGAKFKRLAKETRDKFRTAVDGPLEYVKNGMKVRPHSYRGRTTFSTRPPVRRGGLPVHNIRLPVSFGKSRANRFRRTSRTRCRRRYVWW